MQPKKITQQELSSIFKELSKASEKAIGNYLFKGLRIQISQYKASGTERYMRLYNRRRDLGLCIRCGKKVTKKNPHSGKLYRLCEFHRTLTDRR